MAHVRSAVRASCIWCAAKQSLALYVRPVTPRVPVLYIDAIHKSLQHAAARNVKKGVMEEAAANDQAEETMASNT